jgi:hypothetical protein
MNGWPGANKENALLLFTSNAHWISQSLSGYTPEARNLYRATSTRMSQISSLLFTRIKKKAPSTLSSNTSLVPTLPMINKRKMKNKMVNLKKREVNRRKRFALEIILFKISYLKNKAMRIIVIMKIV